MYKKTLTLIIAIVMVLTMFQLIAYAADNAPKPGISLNGNDMTWNAKDAKVAKDNFKQSNAKDKMVPSTALKPVPSNKNDASGDKITSNAHSGDYPGIYFYWNEKQKEDGILKVDPDVFKWFEDGKFYITAKNSNAYWDYWILQEEGIPTDGGYLLYQIPRYFMLLDKNNKITNDELKNINMIFINGLWRTYDLEIEKIWLDKNGEPTVNPSYANATFTNGYSLGKSTIRLYGNSSNDIEFEENSIIRHNFVKVEGDGIVDENVNKVKFAAVSGGNYKVTFTNKCTDSTLVIYKEWESNDFPGTLPVPTLTNSYVLNRELDIPAGTNINFKENIPVNQIIDNYEYSFDFASVRINDIFQTSGNDVSFTAGENNSYIVIFTNKITKTPLPAEYTIEKIWQNGADLPSDVTATLTNGYSFGGPVQIAAGTDIAFAENSIASFDRDGYRYTFELVGISVNGVDSGNAVNFKTERNTSYQIIVTNKVTKTPLNSTVKLTKIWLDEAGNPISSADLNKYIGAGVYANFKDGNDVTRASDDIWTVQLGDVITITETYPTEIIRFSNNPKIDLSVVPVDGVTKSLNITEANKQYEIVFKNKIIRIDYPVSAMGKIYKGSEKNYNSPKDAYGDSSDKKEFFTSGSLDTLYLTVTYYDEQGNKKTTPEFWYPFMKPPTGKNDIFDFYVPVDNVGTGYFHFQLSLANRSPNRPDYSNDHGKWYMDIVIDMLENRGYFPGNPPVMNPPVPPYNSASARVSSFTFNSYDEYNPDVIWGWYWDWNRDEWIYESYEEALSKLVTEEAVLVPVLPEETVLPEDVAIPEETVPSEEPVPSEESILPEEPEVDLPPIEGEFEAKLEEELEYDIEIPNGN